MLPAAGDRLTPQDFRRLAAFIESTVGIRMSPVKKTMVEGRLRRRLRALGLISFKQYCDRFFGAGWGHDETVHLIDAMTTNKTEFFREFEHFRFLVERALPTLLSRPAAPGVDRPLRVWSAACSVGAEPYTLAMILDDFGRSRPNFRFSILATDICTDALATAKQAIYPAAMMTPVPPAYQRRYVLKARDPQRDVVRLAPHIRQSVSFGRLNLMDEEYPIDRPMDVVFCRNILIYFDKARQEAVLRRLCEHLNPDGYLFVGHSETLAGTNLPVQSVGTAVFVRR